MRKRLRKKKWKQSTLARSLDEDKRKAWVKAATLWFKNRSNY